MYQSIMGQAWADIRNKFPGKELRERQVKKISDRVFNHFTADTGKEYLGLEDLYIAVLLVFNDLNKHLPGPHNDPPSREEVQEMMQTFDLNLDGQLDREEFSQFIKKFTSNIMTRISQNLLIAVVAAPLIALLTKRATEGVPRVGKVVQKIPNAVYASAFTAAVVLIQKISESRE